MTRPRASTRRFDSWTAAWKPGSSRIRNTIAVLGLLAAEGCFSVQSVPRLYGDRYEKCDDPTGVAAFERARQLQVDGDDEAAVDLLRRAVEVCPRHVPYHIAYQDAAFSLPDVVKDGASVQALRTVVMRGYYDEYPDDGKSPLRPYFAARLERLDERESPAQELLAVALARDRQFYFAHYERGVLWRGVGKTHLAVDPLRHALAIRPGFLAARKELAECYQELWEWTRATQHYRVYTRAVPEDFDARRAYLTLIVYRVEDRLEEAAALVRELLVETPEDLTLQMDLAAVYWRQGDTDQAIATYRGVLQRDHAHARAALNLGNLHYEIARAKSGLARRQALAKARTAFRFFRSLSRFDDAYDWFDLNVAVRARIREIDRELGAGGMRTVTWRDL